MAIAKAIEEQLGERRGRNNRRNCDELKGHRGDEIAAKRAGFDSKDTYERARRVVEHGVQELVEAMDKGHHADRTPQGDLRGAASGGEARSGRRGQAVAQGCN